MYYKCIINDNYNTFILLLDKITAELPCICSRKLLNATNMDSKRRQQHCQHPMCIYVHIVPCAHSQFGSAVKVPNMSANYSEHLDMLSIEKNAEELVEAIRHRRRLPKEADLCNKVTYQTLRTAMT